MADRTVDTDTAIQIVGFVPVVLWVLWLVVAGAWGDWEEASRG